MPLSAFLYMVAAAQAPASPAQVQLEKLDGALESRAAKGFATRDPRELGAHVLYLPSAGEAGSAGAAAAEVVLHGGQRWVGALLQSDVPLRLVDGALDPVSGAHLAERYRELVPNPDVVLLPDVGHYPQLEAHDRSVVMARPAGAGQEQSLMG